MSPADADVGGNSGRRSARRRGGSPDSVSAADVSAEPDLHADRWTRCPHCHYGGPHKPLGDGRFRCGSCDRRTPTLDPPHPCEECGGTGSRYYGDLAQLLNNSGACRRCRGSGEEPEAAVDPCPDPEDPEEPDDLAMHQEIERWGA